ncbi:hypothetical protein, partial [Pseudomonas aeruginosa]|uniref:hypothetical protein n=1 Tax=Pseudomonas aeruginosa TaxID=287 RepID=UPI002E772988
MASLGPVSRIRSDRYYFSCIGAIYPRVEGVPCGLVEPLSIQLNFRGYGIRGVRFVNRVIGDVTRPALEDEDLHQQRR